MSKLHSNTQTRQLVERIAEHIVDDGEQSARDWMERTNRGDGFTFAKGTQHGSVVVTEGVYLDKGTLDALLAAAVGAIRTGALGTPEYWDTDLNTFGRAVMSTDTKHQTPTVRVADLTPAERGAINILTPDERKAALLDAARAKAARIATPQEQRQ